MTPVDYSALSTMIYKNHWLKQVNCCRRTIRGEMMLVLGLLAARISLSQAKMTAPNEHKHMAKLLFYKLNVFYDKFIYILHSGYFYPLLFFISLPHLLSTLQPPKHSCVSLLYDLWIIIRTSSVTIDLNLIIRAKWRTFGYRIETGYCYSSWEYW